MSNWGEGKERKRKETKGKERKRKQGKEWPLVCFHNDDRERKREERGRKR